MTGQRIKYDKHCNVEFGTYVKKHNSSMEQRTSRAINPMAITKQARQTLFSKSKLEIHGLNYPCEMR